MVSSSDTYFSALKLRFFQNTLIINANQFIYNDSALPIDVYSSMCVMPLLVMRTTGNFRSSLKAALGSAAGCFVPMQPLQKQAKISQRGVEGECLSARFIPMGINIRPGNGPCIVFAIYGLIPELFIKPGSCCCEQHYSA